MPVRPAPPAAPQAAWEGPLRLGVTLPSSDTAGGALGGVEAIRILYLPLGLSRPEAQEVLARGEVVLTLQRPALPSPGSRMAVDLRNLRRPAGWIVVVAVRAGNITGIPSPTLPWLDPRLSAQVLNNS